MVVKTTGRPFPRATSSRRFVASTSAVRSEPSAQAGSVKPQLKSTTSTAGRDPSVTLSPSRARAYTSRAASSVMRALPRPRLGDELVVFDDHLAADEYHLRSAGDLRALEQVVVHVRVVRLRRDRQ